MIISTRLNSFKARPENYQWQFTPGDPRDLLLRMKRAGGSEWFCVNYPEHFLAPGEAEMTAFIKSSGLKLSGINMRYPKEFSLGIFTNPDPEIRLQGYRLTYRAIDVCRELGGTDVVLWLGTDGFDYPFQMDYPEMWKLEKEGIGKVADYAAEKGIRVSIEYKPLEPRKNSLMGNFGMTMLALAELGRENLGITCDLCHMMMAAEYPAQLIAMALQEGRLFGLHLNDGYARADDGLAVGSVSMIQTLEIFKYLRDYDYEGFLYCDTFPVNEDPEEEYRINTVRIRRLSEIAEKISTDTLAAMTARQNGLGANEYVWDMIMGGKSE